MEPNTSYRPTYYLGQRFVDAKARKFEIIETHWGIPGSELAIPICTIDLSTGHKIHYYDSPRDSQLIKVGIKPAGKADAKVVRRSVDELMEAEDQRLIKFL